MNNLLPQWLKDYVDQFWDLLVSSFFKALKAVVPLILEIVRLLFDGFLTIVSSFIGLLDIGPLMVSVTATWAGLNPNIAYMINASGVPQGLSMLGLAYLIRILLNLIPAAITRV